MTICQCVWLVQPCKSPCDRLDSKKTVWLMTTIASLSDLHKSNNWHTFLKFNKVQFHKAQQLNYNFLFLVFCLGFIYLFFSPVSDGPLNPFLGCVCTSKHADTILKVMFFSRWQRPSKNSDEGVPLKHSALTLQQQTQSFMLRLNWLMVYIKIPFFLFSWHFQGLVMLNMDGPSAQTLPLPDRKE